MMFKPLHRLAPVYFKLQELFNERGTGYVLRDPFRKLTFDNYLKRSFCQSSAPLQNSLSDTKKTNPTGQFRKEIGCAIQSWDSHSAIL